MDRGTDGRAAGRGEESYSPATGELGGIPNSGQRGHPQPPDFGHSLPVLHAQGCELWFWGVRAENLQMAGLAAACLCQTIHY